jgi:DNA polymerase-3 subunit gamma/tau
MAYQVLARKWRPQTFEAVVGQDAITRTLKNALLSSRLAHAYLFAGPRGVGKTTTARLLAKALLCPERKEAEPCGTCAVCQEMQAGSAVDVIEIDGASNRKIDDVRILRENVKYAPARGRYKIYIIDEVHQLTGDAFDALLKTLEEPPPHVIFILATTDPREIPATVLSRVQRFDFKPIALEALAASLARILGEEGVKFDPAALLVIARAAQGSLRDALSLLDTAIAFGGGVLEAEATAQVLGTTAPEHVRAFVAALVGRDAGAALEAVDRAAQQGEDMSVLAREAIEVLRQLLILKAAPTARLPDLAPAETNELRAMAEGASLDEVLYLLRAFLEAAQQIRESPHPRVELEIAAVRSTRRPAPHAIDALLRKLDEVEARLRKGGAGAPAAPRPAPQGDLLAAGAAASETAGRRPERAARIEAAAPAAPPPATPDLAAGWARVVEDVTRTKAMLGAVVNQAVPQELVDGQLRIRLDGNQFHRETLADRASREIVLQAVRKHIDGAIQLEVIDAPGAGGGVEDHPVVQAAIRELGGEIVAVRPRTAEGERQ